MNVAPFQGERHGSAVPMVFMTITRLYMYTLRYVNFRRNSFTWPAAKPPESVNPHHHHDAHAPIFRSAFWCLSRPGAIMTIPMSSFMTHRKMPSVTAFTWAHSFSSIHTSTRLSSASSAALSRLTHPTVTSSLSPCQPMCLLSPQNPACSR